MKSTSAGGYSYNSFVLSGADEPMDTSLPPEDQAGRKEEPMDTEAVSKPHPSASTPVSQNSPGFVLERTLSLPSQPEFSHVCILNRSSSAEHLLVTTF